MRQRLRRAVRRAASNPVLRQSVRSIRPRADWLGAAGVVAFFILPEIVGFLWGRQIAQWAHSHALQSANSVARADYWLLEKFFEDGGSWLNLTIGMLLLAWIVWERNHRFQSNRRSDQCTES